MRGVDDMAICPVCGAECNTFYVYNAGREIVGCDACIAEESAWERKQEDKEDEEIQRGWDEYERV